MKEANRQDRDRKLNSLLQLVDDPDPEVYETVSKEFLRMGEEVLEPLEHLWEVTMDHSVQQRITDIIHQVQFDSLLQKWENWHESKGNILDALILISRIKYPTIHELEIRKQYTKLKQDIWLELNNYLTPLEKINVINAIYFNYYNMSGVEIHQATEDSFFIHKLFETKIGNSYSNGALLAAVLEELDVPIKCILLPHQFLLGYFEVLHPFFQIDNEDAIIKLSCYMDPNNGYVYVQRDIDNYFKKIGEESQPSHFLPLPTVQLIQIYLQELQYFMDQKGDYTTAASISIILEKVFKK